MNIHGEEVYRLFNNDEVIDKKKYIICRTPIYADEKDYDGIAIIKDRINDTLIDGEHYMIHNFIDNEEVVRFLIKNGADVNVKTFLNWTPLYTVNDVNIAKLLIDAGAIIDIEDELNNTPLFINDNDDIINLLIENGADVNHKDINLNTALHHAVMRNKLSKVKALVKVGVDIHAKNVNGNTPFRLAYINGFNEIANYLRSCQKRS